MNKVLEAEKGDRITLQTLHLRMRVVEVVLLVSLVLSSISGYVALKSHQKATDVQEQTGVR